MKLRSAMAVLLAVVVVISAIEVSSWVLGRAVSAIVPSAAVTDADTAAPEVSEIEEPAATMVPALTR
jgi:hypothetical protein